MLGYIFFHVQYRDKLEAKLENRSFAEIMAWYSYDTEGCWIALVLVTAGVERLKSCGARKRTETGFFYFLLFDRTRWFRSVDESARKYIGYGGELCLRPCKILGSKSLLMNDHFVANPAYEIYLSI